MIKSILVVDDDENLLEMMSEYFSAVEYNCFTAANGEDALRLLNTNNIGIAVIDVRMPGMSGLKLLKTIKSVKRDFPIILMTGFELSKKDIANLPFPADAYVTKPFSFDYLSGLITNIVQSRK